MPPAPGISTNVVMRATVPAGYDSKPDLEEAGLIYRGRFAKWRSSSPQAEPLREATPRHP